MMSLLCSKRSKGFPSHSIKIYCICTSSHPQTPPFPTPLPAGPRLASRTGLPSDGLCTLLPQAFCTCCSLYPLHSSPRSSLLWALPLPSSFGSDDSPQGDFLGLQAQAPPPQCVLVPVLLFSTAFITF